MPELRALDPAEARKLCADNHSKGLDIFKSGAVANLARSDTALHGSVAGSASEPYRVSAGPNDDGSYWARCTCPAARRQSLCKHAAALLVAWAEKPDAFVLQAEPATTPSGGLKVESEAKRVREPKADRRTLIAGGLEKAEALLVDLAARGLLAVTDEQVETIGSLAEALESHKLRRLARQVGEIQRAAGAARKGGPGFGERAWARLMADTWFILAATRKALDKGEGTDQAELEELVGKTWLERDLRKIEGLTLVELAYQTVVLASGFRVEASFLLDLESGTLYTEKQITPLRLRDVPRKRSYALPLRVASAGVYPGFAPLRLKLIASEEVPGDSHLWDRAAARAETSAAALRQRLAQSTASLVAPQEAYSLFRPASVLADGEAIHLLDGEGKAIPLRGPGRTALYALRGALARGPLAALFCRVHFAEDALVAEPLGAILEVGEFSDRLARLTA